MFLSKQVRHQQTNEATNSILDFKVTDCINKGQIKTESFTNNIVKTSLSSQWWIIKIPAVCSIQNVLYFRVDSHCITDIHARQMCGCRQSKLSSFSSKSKITLPQKLHHCSLYCMTQHQSLWICIWWHVLPAQCFPSTAPTQWESSTVSNNLVQCSRFGQVIETTQTHLSVSARSPWWSLKNFNDTMYIPILKLQAKAVWEFPKTGWPLISLELWWACCVFVAHSANWWGHQNK